MAYGFGTGVQAGLGATDYSNYLRGALSGAQMQAEGQAAIGRGIGSALSSIGEGIRKYQENKIISSKLAAENDRYFAQLVREDPMLIINAGEKTQKIFGKMQEGKGVSIGEMTYANTWLRDAVSKSREGVESNAIKLAFSDPNALPSAQVRAYLDAGGKNIDVVGAIYKGGLTTAQIGELADGNSVAPVINAFLGRTQPTATTDQSVGGLGDTTQATGIAGDTGTQNVPSGVVNFVNQQGQVTDFDGAGMMGDGYGILPAPAAVSEVINGTQRTGQQTVVAPTTIGAPTAGASGMLFPDVDEDFRRGVAAATDSAGLMAATRLRDQRVKEYLPQAQTVLLNAIRNGESLQGLKDRISPSLFSAAYASSVVQQALTEVGRDNRITLTRQELNNQYPTGQWDYNIVGFDGGNVIVTGLSPRQPPQDTFGQALSEAMVKDRFPKAFDAAAGAFSKDIPKIFRAKALLESPDVDTGLLANTKLAMNKFLAAVTGSTAAQRRVSATQLLESELGSQVYELLVPLGIGARGMDTPDERKFLIKVLAGEIEMTKEALLGLLENRYNLAVNAIDEHNDMLKNNKKYGEYVSSAGGERFRTELTYPGFDDKYTPPPSKNKATVLWSRPAK